MEKYQMNRSGGRPYNHTCGMTRPMMTRQTEMSGRMDSNCAKSRENSCNCHMPGTSSPEMYSHLQHLPLAMAYVPCQEFHNTYDLCYALNAGTIFPELCKPFCGRGGGCR